MNNTLTVTEEASRHRVKRKDNGTVRTGGAADSGWHDKNEPTSMHSLSLSMWRWECPLYGIRHDGDVSAARNLKWLSTAALPVASSVAIQGTFAEPSTAYGGESSLSVSVLTSRGISAGRKMRTCMRIRNSSIRILFAPKYRKDELLNVPD